MKPYTHNPKLFRDHFVGQGLPAFKGARMQRGHGSWISKLKRFAVPLLMAGATAAAPHVSKAVQKVATNAVRHVFPSNPAMQMVVGQAAGRVANGVVGKVGNAILHKKRKRKGGLRPPGKRQATTLANIFA